MKLRNQLLLLLTIPLFCFSAQAQDREVGLFLGTAQYQGDLSTKHLTLSETKPGLGLFMRYYFGPRINFKGAFNYGAVEGDDSNNSDFQGGSHYRRNLSFKSNIFELSGQVEFNILPYISNSKRYKFAPYVFTGASLYYFNPKAQMNDKWYALQPLGTEGQGLPGEKDKYHRVQGAIPYGFGIKYSLGHFWNIGLEVGQRKLFTDYIDDVSTVYPDFNALQQEHGADAVALSNRSLYLKPRVEGDQRGDSKDLDMFLFAGITISKTIRRFSCTGL